MKILAFSDLHLDVPARDVILEAAPKADLVIGAGDFAQMHEGLAEYVAPFDAIAGKALFIAGNNETLDALRAAIQVPVLHGEVAAFGGLRIAGLGCAVPPLSHLDWSFDLTEEQAEMLLAPLEAADVLISHSPPQGVCDRHASLGSLGSSAVRAAAERLQPQYLFCGHIHDEWGTRGRIGATTVANLGPGLNWFDLS